MAQVIQEVKVLHQGKAVDQVAAGKMRQLRGLCRRKEFLSRSKRSLALCVSVRWLRFTSGV